MKPSLLFVGLIIGWLIGLTGVGGGSIMTPLLVAMRVDPLTAVGSDLVVNLFTKTYAAFLHHRQRTINVPVIRALCLGGLPGVFAGVAALVYLRHHYDLAVIQVWIRHSIGAMVALAGALIIASRFLPAPRVIGVTTSLSAGKQWQVAAVGVVVGFAVALTSIGAGSITLPILLMLVPFIGTAELIGSEIVFAALLVPVAAFAHWRMGDVNINIAGNLIAGALPGIYIGARLCRTMSASWLRPAVAVVLTYAGVRLLV